MSNYRGMSLPNCLGKPFNLISCDRLQKEQVCRLRAYDSIWRNILKYELERFGIKGKMLDV